MKLRIATIAGLVVLGSGFAVAQTDAIAQRKAILKQVGEAPKPIAAMMKGEAPFDQAVVQKSLGLQLSGMTDDLRKKYKIKDSVKGVVITELGTRVRVPSLLMV